MRIKKHSLKYYVLLGMILSVFILPYYFAIDIPGLPMLSIQRILELIALIICIPDFKSVIASCANKNINILMLLYLFLSFFTGFVNGKLVDKSWFGIFLEQTMVFYLTAYFIQRYYSVEKFISLIQKISFVLCILGIIEYLQGFAIFSALQTTSREIWTGNFIRGGSYRIMGPYVHSLAYGLVLCLMFPICCINTKKMNIDFEKNLILLCLVVINIFLTGSRSTIIVLFIETLLFYFMFDTKSKFKMMIFVLFIVFVIYIYIVKSNSVLSKNIMTLLYSISDIVFGTSYTTISLYSAQTTTSYRLGLLNLFFDNRINPLFGNGSSYNIGFSVDNNYVGIFIDNGYIGLFLFLIILLSFMGLSRKRYNILNIIGISIFGYAIHLFFVNELHTISALYIFYGLLISLNNQYKKQINLGENLCQNTLI